MTDALRASGLITGLDSASIVKQLVAVERVPITKLENKQVAFESQISIWGTISSQLDALKSKLEEMETMQDFLSFKTSSTDEDIVTATADGRAAAGSYSLEVGTLAEAEKDRSVAYSSQTAEVKAGTLTLTVKDETPIDISIDDGDTLADVAYKINSSEAKVNASVIWDGTSAYLQIAAKETGHVIGDQDGAIVITESYTGLTGTELGLTQIQQAENSEFILDGLTITRESNEISDVLEGVTLNLLDTSEVGSPETITISPDNDVITNNIQSFVEAYNTLKNSIERELDVADNTNRSSTLAGDSSLRQLNSAIANAVTNYVGSIDDAYNSLGSIGVSIDNEGTMSIDETKLKDALNADVQKVSGLFTDTTEGIVARTVTIVDQYTDPVDGLIKFRTDGIQLNIDQLDETIERMERRLESYEERLYMQYANLETTVSSLQAQQNYLAASLGQS